jgi:alpha-1,2-mannosyltransferase
MRPQPNVRPGSDLGRCAPERVCTRVSGVGAKLDLDWLRLERMVVFAFAVLFPFAAGLEIFINVGLHLWGFDYHGGLWQGGRDIFAGRNPYPPPIPAQLLSTGNALITPPLLALINLPLAALPFIAAVGIWDVVQTLALVAALYLCGVRDWRGYVLAAASFPFVATITLGQSEGLFILALALIWRYRDRWQAGVVLGVLIAAKLFPAPLIVWFLLTRRYRNAAISVVVAACTLVASWAVIGFKGMSGYPRLLSADTDAYAPQSHAILSLLTREGLTLHAARLVAGVLALAVSALLVRRARGSDTGTFAALVVAGLLLSPIMWMHYLVLLFVPLAIAHPRPNRWWLVSCLFWLSPHENGSSMLQLLLVIALVCVIGAAGINRDADGIEPKGLDYGPAKGAPSAVSA